MESLPVCPPRRPAACECLAPGRSLLSMAMEQAGLQAYLADARGYLLGEADREGIRCAMRSHAA